jgi:hypothetical protein
MERQPVTISELSAQRLAAVLDQLQQALDEQDAVARE